MFHYRKSYSLERINHSIKDSTCSLDAKEKSSNETISKLLPTKHKPFLGFIYTFLTSVFITLTSVFVKKLSYISPGHLSLVRNAGVFSGCLPIAVYSVKHVFGPKKDRRMLTVRGFLGATALYLNLTAFRYLPLAEAAVMLSIVPSLTTIVAYLYLKEPCGRMQILCLLTSLCGVLLSVRLPELLANRGESRFDSLYLVGLASAVGCVLVLTFTFIALRKMKEIHFSVSLIYFGFLGMIENGIINFATASFEYPECGWDQILVLLIGVFGFMGHCTLTLAVQAENVGIITVVKASLDIIVAMIFQITFFNSDIDIYNISGACFVIASVSMIGFSKWLYMLPEESETRKKFRYLL